jgi:MoaA/NifB/PqqE/SkfB family radical SAM enzyme
MTGKPLLDSIKRKALYRQMLKSDRPHLINIKLNELERKLKVDYLYSFPAYISLCMSSSCNARCSFCHYIPKPEFLKDSVTLEDIKKMTWLKYVSTFNINAGLSESLLNPEFLAIYDYVKNTFPHLNLTLVTNGIRLTKNICEAFVGSLSELLLSLNASTKGTWQKLMRSKGFDNVLSMASYITQLKKERGTPKPLLTLSMVLVKDNIHEAIEFIELAHRIGAEKVVFVHYLLTALTGAKEMAKAHSLYYDKELCDEVLKKAAKRANELGIELIRPLPFSCKDFHISFGERVNHLPVSCQQPWTNCFLTCLAGQERHREVIFCCYGFAYRISYDKSNLTEEYFVKKVWNHPTARYFRKTISIKEGNPICTSCFIYDRFNPENELIYGDINRITDPIFEKVDEKCQADDIQRMVSTAFEKAAVKNEIEISSE